MCKKINIILSGLGTSGGVEVIYKYKQLLGEKGSDVKIYSPVFANNLHRYASKLKNRVHQVYCTGKTLGKVGKKGGVSWVLTISNRSIRDADITIATTWATAYDVSRLNSSKGEKFYFVQDFEIWDNKEWGLNSYKLPLKKIVISSWINTQLRDNLNIGPFPVVMNGIDRSIYFDKRIRKELNKTFLMLNHTLQKKGVKYGIQAFERIREKYPDSRLIMFGMCDKSNIPNYVDYYQNPSKEKLVELYNISNYFIFPSLEEGWGLTPVEAMSCGNIVIGTNTGFVLDLGKHRENMMISEPGDIDGMVRNIEEVLSNEVLAEKIKKNAVETVEKLNWKKSADKLENILYNYKNRI